MDGSPIHQHLLSTALRRRPEFRCQTCNLDAGTVLAAIETKTVHVIVMSAASHKNHGGLMSLIRRVHLAHPEIPIIVLHEDGAPVFALDALRAGARGLFSFGQAPFRALCKCIQRVHEGQVWISNEQTVHMVEALAQAPSLRVVNSQGNDLLTAREEQVVALVAEGLSNRDIAQELQLSEHTVKKYVFRIFDKLGISTRVELVLYALSHGRIAEAERLPA